MPIVRSSLRRRALPLALVIGLSLAGCGKDAENPGAAPTATGGGTASAQGAAVFKLHCSSCHGEGGKGDGIGAAALQVKPRDLTSEPYKYVDVAGSASEFEALQKYIEEGRLESGMPAYGALLTETDLRAVAEHVLSLRPKSTGG